MGGGFVRKHSQAQQHRHFKMPLGWVVGLHFKNRLKKKSHFEEMVGENDKLCSGTLLGIYSINRLETK